MVVSDLFRKAEETILIAGYAVYQGQKVFHALAERMVERPALKVRMFLDIQRRPGDSSSSAEMVQEVCPSISIRSSGQWGSRAPRFSTTHERYRLTVPNALLFMRSAWWEIAVTSLYRPPTSLKPPRSGTLRSDSYSIPLQLRKTSAVSLMHFVIRNSFSGSFDPDHFA